MTQEIDMGRSGSGWIDDGFGDHVGGHTKDGGGSTGLTTDVATSGERPKFSDDESATEVGPDGTTTESGLRESTASCGTGRSTARPRVLCTDVAFDPAFADGRLFVVSDGSLLAFTEADRRQVWGLSIDDAPSSAPAASAERVFWRTEGALHAIGTDHGVVYWSAPTSASIQGSPVAHNRLVASASEGGVVSIVTAAHGRDVRTFQPPQRPSSLAISDDELYVSSLEGGSTAYDATGGTERWRFAPNHAIHAPPVVGQDVVYVSTVDAGGVYALDRESGTPRWSHLVEGSVWTPPVLTTDTVFVAGGSGTLSALRPVDGTQRWSIEIPGWITAGPVLLDETLYVGCTDALCAFDRETGSLRRRFALDGVASVVAGDESVFVVDRAGSLLVVDA